MRVCHSSTVGHVDTREHHVISLARLECTVLRIGRDVVCAANAIVDVLAIPALLGACWVTCLRAKGTASQEATSINQPS